MISMGRFILAFWTVQSASSVPLFAPQKLSWIVHSNWLKRVWKRSLASHETAPTGFR